MGKIKITDVTPKKEAPKNPAEEGSSVQKRHKIARERYQAAKAEHDRVIGKGEPDHYDGKPNKDREKVRMELETARKEYFNARESTIDFVSRNKKNQ